MAQRIQSGGAFLEIDPLTGHLTFEDFLNVPEIPTMEPMEIPKVELGPSFSIFGIPALDQVFADILDKLNLFKQNVDAFIAYLDQLFKNMVKWSLVLVGVTTVAQLIPVLVREIGNLVIRWKRFHQWEKDQAEGLEPEQIPLQEMERVDEVSELSGEDLEPLSLGEYSEPVLDEEGNPVLNPDGTPATVMRFMTLPRDVSDQYDPIPTPPDLSESPVSAEPAEEEVEPVVVDDALIKSIQDEFDPQDATNEETFEFLLDSSVYILHLKNVFLKRECTYGGVRGGIFNGCGMIMDYVQPALLERYSRDFTIRVPNCRTYPNRCCDCYYYGLLADLTKVHVIPDGAPVWTGCECTCGAHCACPCHQPGPDAVLTVRHCCERRKYNNAASMNVGQPCYYSDCWNYPSISTKGQSKPFPTGQMTPPTFRIIRYESEHKDFPYSSREVCDFCKVMQRYWEKTHDHAYHRSQTDVYIFFARGKESTLFTMELGKPLLEGPATNAVYDYLTGRSDLFELVEIKCRCEEQRPICTAVFRGKADDIHANTIAYTAGHAQTVKYLYKPDFDSLFGTPWWYNDPHDYQSVRKRCLFEGILEHEVPEHVFRFYTYRRLTDREWFPRLFKAISDELNRDYPDIPEGADEYIPLRTRLAWTAINKMLSDVVPVPEIYPELAAPDNPLFEAEPEGWAAIEYYGSDWTAYALRVPAEIQPVRLYLKLLDKYYPGWRAFRDAHEPGWWAGFWRQIPRIDNYERTTIFLEGDTHVEGDEIIGEPSWWREFWGPTIRDNLPDPLRPKTRAEVLEVMKRY